MITFPILSVVCSLLLKTALDWKPANVTPTFKKGLWTEVAIAWAVAIHRDSSSFWLPLQQKFFCFPMPHPPGLSSPNSAAGAAALVALSSYATGSRGKYRSVNLTPVSGNYIRHNNEKRLFSTLINRTCWQEISTTVPKGGHPTSEY